LKGGVQVEKEEEKRKEERVELTEENGIVPRLN
jgi:hypothetical protein